MTSVSKFTLFFRADERKSREFEGTTDVRRAAALRRFFPLCAIYKGTPLNNRANSPFSATLSAQWEKSKSVVFAFSRIKYKTESFAFSRVKIKTKSVVLLAQKFYFSRKSRRTRRLRFAVTLRRQQCSGNALGIVFSFFGASQGFPFLKMRQIHPLSSRRPRGALGKSQKRGFDFFKKSNKSCFVHANLGIKDACDLP